MYWEVTHLLVFGNGSESSEEQSRCWINGSNIMLGLNTFQKMEFDISVCFIPLANKTLGDFQKHPIQLDIYWLPDWLVFEGRSRVGELRDAEASGLRFGWGHWDRRRQWAPWPLESLAAGIPVALLQCHLTTCIYHLPIEPLVARRWQNTGGEYQECNLRKPRKLPNPFPTS